ncbi:MAG: rod shape-determining protein MreC [Coriobacteriia bacterium]|nr:rod shape-determining protein MreC [Coriobacteriia bacterium]
MAYTGLGRSGGPTIGQNSKGGSGRQLIVCCAASLVMFTASCRMGSSSPLEAVRSAFTVVTTPVRYIGATVSVPFQGLGNVFANLTSDQESLSDLKAENERLQARNAELEESEQTAKRLQDLLNLKDSYSLQSTGARIISASTDSWSSTVTINSGSASGLTVGMPVMASNGVIGQIVECGATSSTVRLLTDENSSVSAMIQSSRAQGMLKGSATGQVTLDMIASDQEVSVGDVVVTSGLGGVFPKGLPLGKVTNVEKAAGSLYLQITVEIFAGTENFEEVLVITSLTEGQEATAEDISDADAQDTSKVVSSTSDAAADDTTDADASTDGE